MISLNSWAVPVLGSALALGFYDICKKHAVRDNAVTPVLFWTAFFSGLAFLGSLACSGRMSAAAVCTPAAWFLIFAKSLLVTSSWACVYRAMRDLPISIAAPVRASAPLWTFTGSLILFGEIPSALQALGMVIVFCGYFAFSLLGKMEGISFRRHKGIHMIFCGTLLGAASALYDKYLLNTLGIPGATVQFYLVCDSVVILGIVYGAAGLYGRCRHVFQWRWSIPAVGILIALADWLYFYAVSMPDIQISVISLVRRSSCIVTFFAGSLFFKDKNMRGKALALLLIIAGVLILSML